MGKGIISCGLKINGIYDRDIKIGDVIYMERGKKYEFYLQPEKKYFDTEKPNLSSLVEKARWAYIMDSFFDTALKKKKGEVYSEWGTFNKNRGETSIPYLGVGNQYKQGDSISFHFDDSTSLWIGSGYRVEVFNEVPNDGLHFTIVPYKDKNLRYAFFEAPSNEIKIEQGKANDGLLSYGSETFVEVSLHRFGNSKLDNNTRPQDYNVELYLCDGDGNTLEEKLFLTEPLSKYVTSPNTGNLNNSFRVRFNIDDAWKEKYHPGKDYKKYSLEVHIVNTKENTYYSFNIAKKNYSIYGNSGNDEHNVKYLTQNFFVVKKSAFDIILLTQQEKNNMIQYIGDVDYNYREFDPCGYSKISIQELGNKDRATPYVIFEEGKINNTDKTYTSYDIVSGDDKEKEKKIEIKVEGLTVEGVLCQSVLLDEGKKHTDLHNVFQTGRIWTAKPIKIWDDEKIEKNENRVEIDNTRVHINKHPVLIKENKPIPKAESNYENKGINHKKDEGHKGETGAFEYDYDQVADHQIGGASMQEWKENEDYIIKNGDKTATFTLQKLLYVYDKKSGSTNIQTVTSSSIGDKISDYFWRFNYFWLSEKLAQTYFLPISTCRYPNQVARIRVFPDVEWKFSLSVGSVLPDTYSYTNMPVGDINKNHNDKSQKSVRTRTQLKTTPSPVSFDLKIKSTINKSDSREIGAGYEGKIRSVLDTLITIKDTVDELCNTKKAKAGSIAGIFKTRTPITLKIDYPVIAITGGWKFAQDIEHDNKMNVQGSISLGFNPLIKGEGAIDILACLEVYPVAKAVIKAADLVLASVKGEMWFDLYAYGAVNLNGDIFLNKKDIADFQIDTVFGLGVRLGMKVGVTTKQLTFQGDTKQDVTLVGAELSGKGETSLKIKAKRGLDDKGVFIEAGVDFGGVLVFVTAKVRIWDLKGGIEDEMFTLVKPKPDILKKRVHIISDGKD